MSKDGGPAFPSKRFEERRGQWVDVEYSGMSLRDWFAGMALRAIIQAWDKQPAPDSAAKSAYEYADAMLAAREEK